MADMQCGKTEKITQGEKQWHPDDRGKNFGLQVSFKIYPGISRKNKNRKIKPHYEFRNKNRPKGPTLKMGQKIIDASFNIFQKILVAPFFMNQPAKIIAIKCFYQTSNKYQKYR